MTNWTSANVPDSAGGKIFSRHFVALIACIVMAWSGTLFLYPVLPAYVRSIGGEDLAVGLAGAAFSIASIVGRPLAGSVADAFGRRRLLVGGTLAAMVAMLLYQVTPAVPLLLLVRVLHGFAAAVATTVGVVVAVDLTPPQRRAESMGYYTTSPNIATAITPTISLFLMDITFLPLRSFPLIFVAGAIVYACAALFAWLIPETSSASSTVGWVDKLRVRNLYFLPAVVPALILFASTFVYAAVVYFLPLAAASRGGNVALYFFVYGASTVLFRPICGRFADRLGGPRVAVPALVATLLSPLLLALEPSGLVLVGAGLLLGFGVAGLWPPILALILNVVTPESRPKSIATLYVGLDAGQLVGSFVSGAVAQFAGYSAAFVVAAAIVGFALFGFIAYARRLPAEKVGE